MRPLFLAWQDPISKRWFPVGRLEYFFGFYQFSYTKGAEQAKREVGFEPLASFPDMYTVYMSVELFPLFSNRMLPPSRPEYREYLQWLSLPETEKDPVTILARSGGRRVTDTLEVFPCPERNDKGEYEATFFVRALSHMPEESARRTLRLEPGEPLLAMHDFQNPQDRDAIALRTFDRDMYLIGYCPPYLRADLLQLMRLDHTPKITVERVNLPPAPAQFRVMCKATWPHALKPLATNEYDPIVRLNAGPALVAEPADPYRA